ncbi:hypothetical protein [Larkinella punicea]|uniref:Uncharacterized protein n=1 Tax=Larkinella punicea TaxID=2315727 RepID=A0A368JPQ5_9BACT|nr:hypothetical protein [Larkinella punicea]RCR69649.1 hypothetical protein DUE52_09885 [Larkinella punicea]
MENQTKGDSAADAPKPGNYRQSQSMENEDGLPPLSEADTAPMYTDLGLGSEDTYNKGDDEATDTLLYTDTHTAINTAENRSNSLAYEGDIDDLTMEVEPEQE